MKPRPIVWTFSLVLAVGLGTFACSDDDQDDSQKKSSAVHDVDNPSCQAIMDVCHAADIEPGPAHECHSLAHDDVEADCAAQKSSCIATCEAVLADAGVD